MADEQETDFQRFAALLDDLFDPRSDPNSLTHADEAARSLLALVAKTAPAHAAHFGDPPRSAEELRAWLPRAYDALDALRETTQDAKTYPDRRFRVSVEGLIDLSFGAARVVHVLGLYRTHLAEGDAARAAMAALRAGLLLGAMDGEIKPLARRLDQRGGRPNRGEDRERMAREIRELKPDASDDEINFEIAKRERNPEGYEAVGRSRRRYREKLSRKDSPDET